VVYDHKQGKSFRKIYATYSALLKMNITALRCFAARATPLVFAAQRRKQQILVGYIIPFVNPL